MLQKDRLAACLTFALLYRMLSMPHARLARKPQVNETSDCHGATRKNPQPPLCCRFSITRSRASFRNAHRVSGIVLVKDQSVGGIAASKATSKRTTRVLVTSNETSRTGANRPCPIKLLPIAPKPTLSKTRVVRTWGSPSSKGFNLVRTHRWWTFWIETRIIESTT
jgi:hypothetical protein